MKNKKIYLIIFSIALLIGSCKDYLKENPPGELAPENFLSTQAGIEALLYNAYRGYQFVYEYHAQISGLTEYPCDILYQTGGGMNQDFILMSQFQWTSSSASPNTTRWNLKYQSTRDANIIIDNIDNFEASETLKKQMLAEARYIRAVNYIYMYDAFGPVPLRKSSLDQPDLPRATEEEMKTFIETELEAVVADLPGPGTGMYGRANKGMALAFLARFHLTVKNWQKAADAAKRVVDLGYYALFPDYRSLFNVENEPDKNPNNREMIAVSVATNVDPFGNKVMACSMPAGFHHSDKLPEFKAEGLANWASHFRLYDSFVATFDQTNDKRFSLIIDKYVNASGATVNLKSQKNNLRTLKFFDNNANGASHGNDFPLIRYADVLLMRAEALNELNGPNTENINLINMVRTRAGLPNLSAANFTKESLRDHILQERAWEFYFEGMRRSDLIRHGKFISSAKARGVTHAAEYQNRFPIPQGEMDTNLNMVQNEGY